MKLTGSNFHSFHNFNSFDNTRRELPKLSKSNRDGSANLFVSRYSNFIRLASAAPNDRMQETGSPIKRLVFNGNAQRIDTTPESRVKHTPPSTSPLKLTRELHLRKMHLERSPILHSPKVKSDSMLTSKGEIEGYRFINVIGKGSFGVVRLGSKIADGSLVAIKTYYTLTISSAKVASIDKEIELLRNLKHEYIIQLKDVVYQPHCIHLVLEYFEGITLKSYVKLYGKCDEPTARAIFKQLLETLKYLDNKGVSHRDLKPQNIMISDDLNIKLIDFGLANDKQSYRNKCGTLPYMAPEMHIRKEYIGQPADMWASGCILFYILTGKIPFRAIREADLIKLVRRKLKFSFDLSDDSVKLILNLLDQDTCSRYTAEEALMHSWFL